jgi:hypothetical protein
MLQTRFTTTDKEEAISLFLNQFMVFPKVGVLHANQEQRYSELSEKLNYDLFKLVNSHFKVIIKEDAAYIYFK